MAISVNARRNERRSAAQRLADVVGAPAKEWLDVVDDASKAGKAGDAFAAACQALAATNEDAQRAIAAAWNAIVSTVSGAITSLGPGVSNFISSAKDI